MKEQIEKIRDLLNEIETDSEAVAPDSFERNFDALELPDIVCQIVDFLQPRLPPYEAAFYWFLFRHSVLLTGSQHVRVSTNRLSKAVLSSFRKRNLEGVSRETIQTSLRTLEELSVIRKAGDTTQEGTPYFVALPEEIPWCADAMKAAVEASNAPIAVDEKKELDFYNVAENRLKIFERDGYQCYKCGKQLTRFSATLDHIQPVSRGGDNSYDNLVTCCLHDNSRRRNIPISDVLTD